MWITSNVMFKSVYHVNASPLLADSTFFIILTSRVGLCFDGGRLGNNLKPMTSYKRVKVFDSTLLIFV